jgi:hypothetical protein
MSSSYNSSSSSRNQILQDNTRISIFKRIQELADVNNDSKRVKTSVIQNEQSESVIQNEHNERVDNFNFNYFDDSTLSNTEDIKEIDDDKLFTSTVKMYNYGDQQLIPDFNIIHLVNYYQSRILSGKFIPADDNLPLTKVNSVNCKVTKGIFARALNEWFQEENITQNGILKLLNILNNSFGDLVRLPVLDQSDKETNQDHNIAQSEIVEDMLQHLHVKSTINDYTKQVARFFSFDQCINNCTVFVGETKGREKKCTNCKATRFRPCVIMNCKNRGRSDCDHLLTNGVALKKFHYRSLIILIRDLVATEYFVQAINYVNTDYKKFYNDESWGSDIFDGHIARQNLLDMEHRFNTWKTQNPLIRSGTQPVNILFSEFYDGVQLFKRRVKDLNCLVTSILNLPPTYRGKEGIATFLTAVYEGKHAFAEQAIFSDMYVNELQTLFEGFEIKENGKTYFIQARLILHIHDTKSAERVLQLQSCASNSAGCP